MSTWEREAREEREGRERLSCREERELSLRPRAVRQFLRLASERK
jgi:hypothetical protein